MTFLYDTTIEKAFETHPTSYIAGSFGSYLIGKTAEARILQEYGNFTSTHLCPCGINTGMFLS